MISSLTNVKGRGVPSVILWLPFNERAFAFRADICTATLCPLLHCNAMSALGQERTCAAHKVMSALPPIATSIAYFHGGCRDPHGLYRAR